MIRHFCSRSDCYPSTFNVQLQPAQSHSGLSPVRLYLSCLWPSLYVYRPSQFLRLDLCPLCACFAIESSSGGTAESSRPSTYAGCISVAIDTVEKNSTVSGSSPTTVSLAAVQDGTGRVKFILVSRRSSIFSFRFPAIPSTSLSSSPHFCTINPVRSTSSSVPGEHARRRSVRGVNPAIVLSASAPTFTWLGIFLHTLSWYVPSHLSFNNPSP